MEGYQKCCLNCFNSGEVTFIREGDYKGGVYYWCPKCRGAVQTIGRNTGINKLLIEVNPSASPEEVAEKVRELLPEVNVRPNGFPNTLEVGTPWAAFDAKNIIDGIVGIKECMILSL